MAKKLEDKHQPEHVMTEIFRYRKTNITRLMLERTWFRNILYFSGEQWLEWHKQEGTFRKRQRPQLVPTPVANKIRDSVKSEKALILNKNYVPKIWPNSNTPEDIEAARIGELLTQDMDMRNDEEFAEEKEKLIDAMLLCGTSFMRVFPDLDRGEYGIDKNGELIKSGEVVAEFVSPFSIVVDPAGDTLNRKRYVGIQSFKNKEWVEDTFNVLIKAASDRDELQYTHTLMKYISNVSPWKSAGINSSFFDEEHEHLVIFKEMEFKPTKMFPNGRYIVMANDQLLIDAHKMPMPMDSRSREWSYSITDFHYNRIPGRFWADSFINDLISPQDSINSIDQALIMNRKSLGRTRVGLPVNSKIRRLNEEGEQFIAIEYDPRLTGGQPPRFDNGIPLPNQILDERRIHETTMQDTSGDPKNVLKGQVPTAGASGYLVDVLQETVEASHGPDIARFYRGLKRVYRNRLVLASKLYTEKRMIKVVGPNEKIAVKEFKGADLRNNTDIRLELTSGAFKTKASQAHALLQLMQTGMLQVDPITQRNVLNKLGFADLAIDKPNVHLQRADKEHYAAAAGDVSELFIPAADELGNAMLDLEAPIANNDPYFKFDDHAIHYEAHVRFILSDAFKDLPDKIQKKFMAHTELTKAIIEMEVKKAQMEAMTNQLAMMQAQQPEQPAPPMPMEGEPLEGGPMIGGPPEEGGPAPGGLPFGL
jgi:hypothetical protein